MERFTIPIFAAKLMGFTSNFISGVENTLNLSTLLPLFDRLIASLCELPLRVLCVLRDFAVNHPLPRQGVVNSILSNEINPPPNSPRPSLDQLNTTLCAFCSSVVSNKRKIHHRIIQFLISIHHAELKDFTFYFLICNHWFKKNQSR